MDGTETARLQNSVRDPRTCRYEDHSGSLHPCHERRKRGSYEGSENNIKCSQIAVKTLRGIENTECADRVPPSAVFWKTACKMAVFPCLDLQNSLILSGILEPSQLPLSVAECHRKTWSDCRKNSQSAVKTAVIKKDPGLITTGASLSLPA